MRYLFATNNPGKVKEIQAVFAGAGMTMLALADLNLFYEPPETGNTFEANAIQKATMTRDFLRQNGITDLTVLADDSGLCIDALGGEPGVDSANYMGRQTPYETRNAHLINQMQNAVNRAAQFVCVIACAYPNGDVITTKGVMEGEIAHEPGGTGGFGFDPIFYLPAYGKTSAALSMEEKNAISHRGKALAQMIRRLTHENTAD